MNRLYMLHCFVFFCIVGTKYYTQHNNISTRRTRDSIEFRIIIGRRRRNDVVNF